MVYTLTLGKKQNKTELPFVLNHHPHPHHHNININNNN